MKRGPRSPAAGRSASPGAVSPGAGSTHPEPTRLVDLVDGRLTAAVARSVRAHLRTCAPCAELEESFASLVGALAIERAEAPPAALSDWARTLPETLEVASPAAGKIVPATRRARAGLALAVRGVAAARTGVLRLVADSWGLIQVGLIQAAAGALADATGYSGALAGPLPLAARSGGPGSGGPRAACLGRRRLLFSAPPFDLDLEVDYAGETDPRRLHGQILPVSGPRRDWQGSEIHLTSEGRTVARARVDRRGEFRLAQVRPGRYSIEVRRAAMAKGGPPERAGRSATHTASTLIEV